MDSVANILLKTKGNFPDIEFSDLTLSTTEKLVEKLYKVAKQNNLWWFPPQIGRDFDGGISLDWWHSNRRYSIFVIYDEISYIAYWGNKTDEEREYGDINYENNLLDFWSWIAE